MSEIDRLVSNSEAETEEFAASLVAALPAGAVVALSGDLGAGKTVFAKGAARGLGVDEPVSSPTFNIVQEYQGAGRRLNHLDLYRVDSPAAALAFGVDEYLDDPGAVTLVEWPERAAGLLPPDTLLVTIRHLSPNSREITVQNSPP